MKLYEVYDPREDCTEWFTNKLEALRYWSELEDTIAEVRLIDIGRPTVAAIIACLKGEGYARSSIPIWPRNF